MSWRTNLLPFRLTRVTNDARWLTFERQSENPNLIGPVHN